MMQQFDVAIIGAGPAGSAAAIGLARKGYAVALFDKEQFPREKLCGDFVNPSNWPIYRDLGVENSILSEQHEKISAIRITTPSGAEAVAPLSETHDPALFGLGISRAKLDSVLVRAAQRHGVTVLQKRRVRKLTPNAGEWRIDNEQGNDMESARARIIIGADGRNSWVANHLGLAGASTSGRSAVGFQFRLPALDQVRSRLEMHVFPGGYAGLVHLGDGTANLCLAVAREKVRRQRQVDWASSLGLSRNPFLREIMSRAQLCQEVRSIFPVYFPPRRSYAERALLVGDAAQVVEPVTGEGVYFAARSGLMAAETIDEAFQHGDFSLPRFSAYQRRCRHAFWRRRALNRLMQYMIYRPAIGESLIRFSVKRQGLLNSIVKAVCIPERLEVSATA
jgi:geranylgeranyl reductase family protein